MELEEQRYTFSIRCIKHLEAYFRYFLLDLDDRHLISQCLYF